MYMGEGRSICTVLTLCLALYIYLVISPSPLMSMACMMSRQQSFSSSSLTWVCKYLTYFCVSTIQDFVTVEVTSTIWIVTQFYILVNVFIIDKLYPDRQCISSSQYCRIETSAALFLALGIVLAHILKQLTQPTGPASLKYGRGQVGSIWGRKSRPLPFSLLALLILWFLWCYAQ